MQTPPNLNDQQKWGGQCYQSVPEALSNVPNEQDQPTLIAGGRQNTQARPFSQAGFIASSSDNLFHPVSQNPDVPSTYNFSLPQIPSPRHRTYNPPNISRRPLPYHSPLSSYNNPTFAVPPLPQNNHIPSSSINPSLGLPPPIPPHIRSQPAYSHFQPAYNHFQPAYNHFQPAYNHFQPAYNHFASVPPVYQNQPLYQPQVPPPVLAPPRALAPSPVLPPSSTSSSPSPTVPTSKTLPTVTHIPVLTTKTDFFAWDEGVHALIRANNLLGHILDPSVYVDPTRPDLAPTPPPVLSMSSSARDIAASNRWWADDNVVIHILVSRLSSLARNFLPAPNISNRTALSIYKLLLQHYGTCNFADCTELLNSLHNSTCPPNRIQEFVTKWRAGLSKLHSAHFTFNIKICVTLFVHGLPPIPAFNALRADLPRRIADITDDRDFGAFVSLTETVLELDTIFRPLQSQTARVPRAPLLPAPPTTSLPASTVPDPTRLPKKDQICNNCKSRGLRCVGHTDGTCFQPGGGMEGRREEYFNNKGRIHVMFAECLENAFLLSDPPIPPDPSSSLTSPILSPALDHDLPLPPIANLSVSSYVPNFHVREDLYTVSEPQLLLPFASPSIDFSSTAFVSIINLYNALLDSRCTHHIIRDRALFRNYTAQAISVGTANCGSLEALGTGDVEFSSFFGDRQVIFTLRSCLFAPTAPINLLSVGALAERGMFCLFSPGGITKISYPEDHPRLPSFSLSAKVVNHLSFLKLSFISPELSLAPAALPAAASVPVPAYTFPRIKLDSVLWHRRFGHIGMEATKAALTKDYVTGVRLDGVFVTDHCIPCLVGKSPQRSYSLTGHRASKIGELLHMDLCGPFPVQAPHGEKYFFNILDDKSNWGFTYGLRLKSDAFQCYLKTESFLERSTSAVVLTVRSGGELELTAGKMGAHLASKGIVSQRTVAYAHKQNGKSERYIRTIEEGGQALLADSGLPMSFWLDAVLTRQYLVNRLPTTTLPSNITPFESLMGDRKPDLSHLRVWGCDCYVAVPNETRGKAGPKRFRAIFVGYEEHRIGWRVRDLVGKYSFSNDVVFNENLPARLGVPRSLAPIIPDTTVTSPSHRRVGDRPRICTAMGQAYDEVLELKHFRNEERRRRLLSGRVEVANGGAEVVDALYGGVDVGASNSVALGFAGEVSDLSPSVDVIESFISFLDSSSFPDQIPTESLTEVESTIIQSFFSHTDPLVFKAFSPPFSRPFDLSKPPSSYVEALAHPDAQIWHSAMDRERQSLLDMGAFEEVELPKGARTIGLKWVYDIKTDATGTRIPGKEKARLVAQGFNQRPGQYDETYAPVGIVTGNPRVFLGNPYPYPRKPVPTATGAGFYGYGYGFLYNPRVTLHL